MLVKWEHVIQPLKPSKCPQTALGVVRDCPVGFCLQRSLLLICSWGKVVYFFIYLLVYLVLFPKELLITP